MQVRVKTYMEFVQSNPSLRNCDVCHSNLSRDAFISVGINYRYTIEYLSQYQHKCTACQEYL